MTPQPPLVAGKKTGSTHFSAKKPVTTMRTAMHTRLVTFPAESSLKTIGKETDQLVTSAIPMTGTLSSAQELTAMPTEVSRVSQNLEDLVKLGM